ncbi:MAG: 50S ribosomal protein L13 [Actinomycetota bacterium]
MKTFTPKASDIQRAWWVVDADGLVLGRLASEVAHILRGKHKPVFAPHLDMGDYVVVINAGKVKLTGNKANDKYYIRHSGFPGGLRETPYGELLAKRPEIAIEKAVKGMLPHNRLGRAMIGKLKVYADGKHPHAHHNLQPFPLSDKLNANGGK